MAQSDVFRLTSGVLVVDLQTDLIGIEASRIVAPLRDPGWAWIVRVQARAAVSGIGHPDRRGLRIELRHRAA
jgi:toxin CcdB